MEETTVKCPVCKTPAAEKYHPFCSKRCADIDLGKWFNERYTIDSEEESDLPDGEDYSNSSYKEI